MFAPEIEICQRIRSRALGDVRGYPSIGSHIELECKSLGSFCLDDVYDAYAIGHWKLIPLFNRDGDVSNARSFEYNGQGQWTHAADLVSHTKKLIETLFHVERMRSARIAVMGVNSGIRLHRDYMEFNVGFNRIHVPLVTNSRALNGEGRLAYHMPAGSVWYLEGSVPHWAVNLSSEARYHLVCDFEPTSSPEKCLKSTLHSHTCKEPFARERLPDLERQRLRSIVETASLDSIDEICDIADQLYLFYDCGRSNPYDLLISAARDHDACFDHVLDRRLFFLGI